MEDHIKLYNRYLHISLPFLNYSCFALLNVKLWEGGRLNMNDN